MKYILIFIFTLSFIQINAQNIIGVYYTPQDRYRNINAFYDLDGLDFNTFGINYMAKINKKRSWLYTSFLYQKKLTRLIYPNIDSTTQQEFDMYYDYGTVFISIPIHYMIQFKWFYGRIGLNNRFFDHTSYRRYNGTTGETYERSSNHEFEYNMQFHASLGAKVEYKKFILMIGGQFNRGLPLGREYFEIGTEFSLAYRIN